MQHNTFDFFHFHFENNYWFLGLLLIPVLWALYAFYYQNNTSTKDLEKFVDSHLIPHIIRTSKTSQISVWRSLILGSILWFCFMAAMAGPRWNFKEFESYKDNKTLLILLDLSKSMDANDIKPSRIIRARQEIEDIVNMSKNVKIGLVAFAANAHMVSPITEDMSNIRHLLPLIGTDLVSVQGTNIIPALKTAKQMLIAEPGSNKSILIITDGGGQDQDTTSIVDEITSYGIAIDTLGIATTQGITFVDDKGKPIIHNGNVAVSRLEKEKLQALSKRGEGKYFDTNYTSDSAKQILNLIENRMSGAGEKSQNTRHWEERFYIFIFPVMLVLSLWFRKGFTFPIILLVLLTPAHNVQAIDTLDHLLLNKKQIAKKAFEEIDDVDTALSVFDDPYKRGVAYYKSGKFKEAEKSFRSNKRKEVKESALYNLGNSLVHQNKLDDAIKIYEELLKENPNHANAKHNLEIAKQMVFVKEEKEKDNNKNKKPPKEDGQMLGGGGAGGSDDDNEDDGGGAVKNSDESSDESKDKQNSDSKNDQDEGEEEKDNNESEKEVGKDKNNGKDNKNDSSSSDSQNDKENSDSKNDQDEGEEEKDNNESEKEVGKDKNNGKDNKNDSSSSDSQNDKENSESSETDSSDSDYNSGSDAKNDDSKNNEERDDNNSEKEGGKNTKTKHDEYKGNDNQPNNDAQTESEINQMLDLISNDHKNFLKNQFYIESVRNQTKSTKEPW